MDEFKHRIRIMKRFAGNVYNERPESPLWGSIDFGNSKPILGFSTIVDPRTGDVFHFIAVKNKAQASRRSNPQ